MEIENLPNSGSVALERLLTAQDVSGILQISRSYCYHLLQTGSIPTVRIGKSCRVRPQDLAEYIEKNLHHQVYQR